MTISRFVVSALLLAAICGRVQAADVPLKVSPSPPAKPSLYLVNENSLSYFYVFNGTNPGAGPTPKHVVNFSHFDIWAYGSNFVSVDWLKATNGAPPPFGAPAAPCDLNLTPGCPGFTEIYALIRSTLGWNQLFNTKAFTVGPLQNIEFAFGVDVNTDNTTLASAKRSIQAGLQFDFSAPYKGSLNVGVFAYKEWQHNGFAALGPINPSGRVDFDTTWAVEALYTQPLGFLPESFPLTFKSFAVIRGPKGCGEPCNPGPGLVRTTEINTQQTLSLDVGKMLGYSPNMFSVWGAYRYWKNKFGIDPIQPPGVPFIQTLESTWIVGATWTF